MYLSKEKKAEIFKKHGGSEGNTGSTEGQIALFTYRINHLTKHLKENHKDFNTERSLVKLVGKRRSLLDYLKKKEWERTCRNCQVKLCQGYGSCFQNHHPNFGKLCL